MLTKGRQQEFEVMDLRKALHRSLQLTSVVFNRGIQTNKGHYWASDEQPHSELPTQKNIKTNGRH